MSGGNINCRKCHSVCPTQFNFCDQCGYRLRKSNKLCKKRPRLESKYQISPVAPETHKKQTSESWFWGATTTLPRLDGLKPKPAAIAPNQEIDDQTHLNSFECSKEKVVREPAAHGTCILWGNCLSKAKADYLAKEALLNADITADENILAHMEAQAQSHAFLNDERFRFACKMKRELESKLRQRHQELSQLRNKLDQLEKTSSTVQVQQSQISALQERERKLKQKREKATHLLQTWWRKCRKRALYRHRLIIRIYRGYLHYRYKCMFHTEFQCFMYFRIDKIEKSHIKRLEFVCFLSSSIFLHPYVFHYHYPKPEIIINSVLKIQRFLRAHKNNRDLWAKFLNNARLLLKQTSQQKAIICIQSVCRQKLARKRVVGVIKRTFGKCIDSATGHEFYVNLDTGISQWTKPKLLYNDDLEMTVARTSMAKEAIYVWMQMDTPRRSEMAATKIISFFKHIRACRMVQQLIAYRYEKHFDETTKKSFYFDTRTGLSSWSKPKLLKGEIHISEDTTPQLDNKAIFEWAKFETPRRQNIAATKIQGLYRSLKARTKLREMIKGVFTKCLDTQTQRYFYYNSATGASQWTKPLGLGKSDLAVLSTNLTTQEKQSYFNLDTPRRLEAAACEIQCLYRAKRARDKLRAILSKALIKCYDDDSQSFFYYNTKTGISQWSKPKLMGSADIEPTPVESPKKKSAEFLELPTQRRMEAAATKLQCIYRTRIARTKLRTMIMQTYKKYLDPDSQMYFYYNVKSGESQWTKPKGLGSTDIEDAVKNSKIAIVVSTPRREEMAASMIQSSYRCYRARKLMADIAAGRYQCCFDPDLQVNYYFDVQTGESSWTRPRWLIAS
ncbi:hypothetical protein THRCLA_00880 [Thraustotheca clavata]|uniref:Probable pectate lyase F n=1 Tax=Thraustotheca clavata TaxID=74557 RepID=A0A1W0AA40_9STRA|nr:hypothetical protein THRCLA_00880 [Thraustotheca clavata]